MNRRGQTLWLVAGVLLALACAAMADLSNPPDTTSATNLVVQDLRAQISAATNAARTDVLGVATNGANMKAGSLSSNAFDTATRAALGAGGAPGASGPTTNNTLVALVDIGFAHAATNHVLGLATNYGVMRISTFLPQTNIFDSVAEYWLYRGAEDDAGSNLLGMANWEGRAFTATVTNNTATTNILNLSSASGLATWDFVAVSPDGATWPTFAYVTNRIGSVIYLSRAVLVTQDVSAVSRVTRTAPARWANTLGSNAAVLGIGWPGAATNTTRVLCVLDTP